MASTGPPTRRPPPASRSTCSTCCSTPARRRAIPSAASRQSASLFGDRLTGGVGSNVIEALAGDDTLDGGAGKDRLVGNLGQDWLTGGAGADTFAFKALKDSPVAAPDIITDFSQAEHDIIDLTLLDGRPFVAGNQEVQFVGTAAFLGKGVGQVRYRHEGGNTIIELDTSNRVADLASSSSACSR